MNVPTIYDRDTARVRRSDPATSHRAGDASQANLKPTKIAVLQLVHQEGTLTGEEINDLYSLRTDRNGWPLAKHDTPRKRAGELFIEGFLDSDGEQDGGRVYRLSLEGKAAIGVHA